MRLSQSVRAVRPEDSGTPGALARSCSPWEDPLSARAAATMDYTAGGMGMTLLSSHKAQGLYYLMSSMNLSLGLHSVLLINSHNLVTSQGACPQRGLLWRERREA